MSAPNTNVEKQEKSHRPSLLGIRAGLVYAAVLLTGFVAYNFYMSGAEAPPAGAIAGSSITEEGTEASTLEGYKADSYGPGGNSKGTVSGNPNDY